MKCANKNCILKLNDKDQHVVCSGACREVFHLKCASVSPAAYTEMSKSVALKWFCEICTMTSQTSVMMYMGKMLTEMRKNDEKADNSLHCLELKMIDMFAMVDKKFEKILEELHENRLEMGVKFTKVAEECNLKEVQDSIVKVVEECCDKEKEMWTKVVKRKPKKKNEAVVVKPKDANQNRDVTESRIQSSINPSDYTVQGMKNAANGGIIIECADEASCSKLMTDAKDKLGDDYCVAKPKKLRPRIKMLKVWQPADDGDFVTQLKGRNELIGEKDEILVVAREQVWRKKAKVDGCLNMVLEVDGELYNKIMAEGRLLMGWRSCTVVDGAYIKRCYKCYGFNHKSDSCRNQAACSFCGENEHVRKDCLETHRKCINCIVANKNLKLGLDVNHDVWSEKCRVFQRKLEQSKRSINYLN